jgi:hypothetical protein
MVQWLTFVPRIQKVTHFILCLEMSILNYIFSGFTQYLQANAGIIFWNGPILCYMNYLAYKIAVNETKKRTGP